METNSNGSSSDEEYRSADEDTSKLSSVSQRTKKPVVKDEKTVVQQTNINISQFQGTLHVGPNITQMLTSTRSRWDIHVDDCLESKRVVEDCEVEDVAKAIGKRWRKVGEKLKIDPDYMDFLDKNKDDIWPAPYRLAFFWTQCYDRKATVGRLARAMCKAGAEKGLREIEP